jgi:hypothetical protein
LILPFRPLVDVVLSMTLEELFALLGRAQKRSEKDTSIPTPA